MSDATWIEKLLAGDKSAADATTGKVQRSLGDGKTARPAPRWMA